MSLTALVLVAAEGAGGGGGASIASINESGRVLADLNDWRAIVFVLVLIIFLMIMERFWLQREMRLERKEQREISTVFGNSADKVADAISAMREELGILRAVSYLTHAPDDRQKTPKKGDK